MPYDLFISYAVEDRDFTRLLVAALYEAGVRSMWYDEVALRPGDSLRESLEQGLSDSRHVIVLCTKNYFAENKHWTKRELSALFSLNKRLIPIWHGLNAKDIQTLSPFMSDVIALQSDIGLDTLVSEIAATLKEDTESKYYESELFWFLAKTYVRKLVGDLPLREQQLLDISIPQWETHVRNELKISDPVIEAVVYSIQNVADDQEMIERAIVILRNMVR